MAKWQEEHYGVTSDGRDVKRFTSHNAKGIEVDVINFGGIITAIRVPDKNGKVLDIVAGYDGLLEYETNPCYFGALIGRVANRIKAGKFEIQGEQYQLDINNGPNHLHGGKEGFDKKLWDCSVDGEKLCLSYVSPDGDQKYPGKVTVNTTYELTDDNQLRLEYTATTSHATPVNLTNHSYFNLAGHASGNVHDHTVQILASKFIPKDDTGIPTGEIASVSGTQFDLRQPVRLGSKINDVPGDLGYDHCFSIDGKAGEENLAARVEEETSGCILEIYTNQPGVQFYTANYVQGIKGKNGAMYEKHSSLALETGNYPDAVNQASFPKSVLEPGETYHHVTTFRFSTRV